MPFPASYRRVLRALALPLLLLLLAALRQLESVREPIAGIEATLEGRVEERGDVPGGAAGVGKFRYWSTWNGSDNHFGRLVLGPFDAPARFGLLVRGYPGIGGNRLVVENTRTGEALPLVSDANPGESWAALHIDVPHAWHDTPVRIVADDRAAEWGGWMAISEPFVAPAWAGWWRGIVPRLAAFLLTGLSLAVLALGAHAAVRRLRTGPDSAAWIIALGLVAALGYLAFWLHFWSATIGIVASWVLFGVAALAPALWRPGATAPDVDRRDAWVPPALMIALGLFAFAVLHLYTVDARQASIAQGRFGSLPADNEIPQVFAQRLLEDRSPRALFGDWLSSDRPPLQTGWQLLVARPALAAGVEFDTAMQGAGMWFQLAWIPAVWGWLRRMRVAPGPCALVIAAIAPCTFLLLNTVFIWPKLAAAGLLLGAFLCWFDFDKAAPPPPRRHDATGGALAALAWLAHGGVAFALLPLAAWVLARLRRATLARWLVAAGAFAVFALPWSAYQRFYEPPGNRLLKWHLGGHIPPDDRGTWETLRTAYGGTPLHELASARIQNFKVIGEGEWRSLVTFRPTDVGHRRGTESAYTFFAMGWWNLGFLALAGIAAIPAWRRGLDPTEWRGALAAAGWAVATTVVWGMLMFIPGSTLLHQGSYSTPLLFLPVLAWALWRLHPALFGVAAVAQLVGFVVVTLPPSPPTPELSPRGDAVALALLAGLAAVAAVLTAWMHPRESGRRPLLPLRRPELPLVIVVAVFVAAVVVIGLARVRLTVPDLAARADGGFQLRGAIPFAPPTPFRHRYWSSWQGADRNRGTLTIGPFTCPDNLAVFVRGYPSNPGNTIELRRGDTGGTQPQSIANAGESWTLVALDFPAAWVGQPVEIHAADQAVDWGGWLALSEPCFVPPWSAWAHGLPLRLAHFAVVFATWATLAIGISRLLHARSWVDARTALHLPCVFGGVALFGLLLFAIGMLSAVALAIMTWLALAAAIARELLPRRTADGPPRAPDWAADSCWTMAVTVICGVFVVFVLHRFETAATLSELAQTRHLPFKLPADNVIPQFLADRLLHGEPARTMFGDWHSSDRPPLQSGWVLALVPPALALGLDYDTSAQAAGIGLQFAAVPAMWMLLRLLGAGRAATALVILAVIPAGFFLINLSFAWPKLAGGAFTLVAFLLAFLPPQELPRRRGLALAGVFAGLGWLAHGSVAFSFLAAVPWIALALRRATERRTWLAAAVGFLALALPWTAYQKAYDPPGNRLLKMHLAGVVPPDERGTLETLAEAYRASSLRDWAAARLKSVHSIVRGPWREVATLSFRDKPGRSSSEFFHLFHALGWWNLGFAALAFLPRLGRITAEDARAARRLLGWTALTLAVWVVLMFVGGATVVHQGSYGPLLVLFPVLAFALLRLHWAAFAAVVLAQLVTFLLLWLPKPDAAPLIAEHPSALAGIAACAVVGAVVVRLAHRSERGGAGAPTCGPTAA